MTTYRVRYETDVDADSPLEAAQEAHRLMVDPQSMPPILEVHELGPGSGWQEIDLMEHQ